MNDCAFAAIADRCGLRTCSSHETRGDHRLGCGNCDRDGFNRLGTTWFVNNVLAPSDPNDPLTKRVACVTKDRLEDAPKYVSGSPWDWNDTGRGRVVDDYYGATLT